MRVATGLAVALDRLHERGLIHKDIKPANILTNAATGAVWLTGFGIASRLLRERQTSEPPEVIAGTLAYMAPEQTGRMNRSIDARSDLYAYGVTLYEMLTGALPFNASDPMEWIHCHMARQPIPPNERVENIPGPIAAIVMKLLAKTAEERYQTAAGVEADLRKCLAEWEALGRIDPFPLGVNDVSERLLIPERLYGRKHEIEALLAAFDRVVTDGTPELVLVSGYSGAGKSSVVNELHKALVPTRGLFASGKFDQYKRDIPYSTLAQALQSLVRQILSQSDAKLSQWRDTMRLALGPNGQFIVNLIPEIEIIIGKQPPVPDLPPQDAKNRFQMVLRRFLSVFARPEHPLALFLDDLQWLDAATLDLFQHLITHAEVRHLLLVGAYRDNEVGASHPFMKTLEGIRAAEARVNKIVLAPLGLDDVGRLLADTLHCERERAQPLAQLVHEKTGGNPFFAIQFITALSDEGLIAFDPGAVAWRWDLVRIRAKGYTDNVVDLMIGKLNRMPTATQETLKHLASLGNSGATKTLSIIHGASEEQIHTALWDAVRVGLVFRLNGAYTFLHDRVQEAAYALIAEGERAAVHLRIGRLLAAETSTEKIEETVFEIVNHLNRGSMLITSREEREQLAELNLIAGMRAKAATAYASALNYLKIAGDLLAENHWESRYLLAFAIELNRAESEFLTGEHAAAEERLALLSVCAANISDRAAVTCLRVEVFTTISRPDIAVEIGIEYLKNLGIAWQPHPTNEEVGHEFERMWKKIGSRPIETLIDLPLMTEPDWRATMDVLAGFISPALFTDGNLFALTLAGMVNLSLKHGNCDASCLAYTQLIMVLGPHFGDYLNGFRFGQLGFDLVEQRGLARYKARVYLVFGHHVIPWARHLKTGQALLRRAFEAVQETGDLTFAAYGSTLLITNMLACGEPLGDIQQEVEKGIAFAHKAQFNAVVDSFLAQLGLIKALRGDAPDASFNKAMPDEDRLNQLLQDKPNLNTWWYWMRKLQTHFYAAEYASAVAAAEKLQALPWINSTFIEAADYHFYGGLARAALCDSTVINERPRAALMAHHQQLALWAKNCPENFGSPAALVAAEIARIEGREMEAERSYEEAITLAREHGFIQHEALANEFAARFYAARGFETIAHAYLRNARYCFLRWGADGKVRQLDQAHPHLREEPAPLSPTITIGAPVEQIDLATVIKVSQAVSGEILLSKLIDTLMRIALEHAGAERGLLILRRGNDWRIEAEATTGHDAITVRLLGKSPTPSELPDTVLKYVLRTKESVILDDASATNQFSADPYIGQKHLRSVLCLPLVKQGTLTGVLYLENNLASHVFTPVRIEVLKLLASQAAISLENACLYDDLRKENLERSRAEEKIRQDERELRQIVEVIPQLVVVLAPDGSFLYANERVLEYTGYTEAEVVAGGFRERVAHPDDVERMRDERQQALALGVPFEVEQRVRRKDGQYRWFLTRLNPLKDEQGRVIRWYATGTDIDDRKQAEERVQKENLALREEIDKTSMFEEIVGTSPALQKVLSRVSKVAPTDSTVLITGETGTGKELIARAIHKRSQRSARAFVSVNCAATPPSLIASELFGHEKGAFTGALQRRLGRFELAEGGTIFLDEIGELPMETQIALLRVLQEHAFERVGGSQTIRADVRVIAATNRDLQAAITQGTFRRDLFYRINVFPIEMPALRERKEDIPMLVEYFIDRYASAAGKKIRSIDKRTLALFQSYPWPGNIRELQNVIERSVILSEMETFAVDESWLSPETVPTLPARRPLSEKPVDQEKERIEAALAESKGKVFGPTGAAARLGMPPSTLDSKIKTLKINKYRFKSE